MFWQYHEWAVRDGLVFFKGELVSRLIDYSEGRNGGLWKSEHLFASPFDRFAGGLFWRLRGAVVRSIGPQCAFMDGGEVFELG